MFVQKHKQPQHTHARPIASMILQTNLHDDITFVFEPADNNNNQ